MPDDRPPDDLPPLIAWMSRHGLWLLAAIIVIELGFHAFAVFRTRAALPLLALCVLLPASLGAQLRAPIPGSAVDFTLVPVAAGTVTLGERRVPVAPFAVTRSEVTWEQYDAYALSEPTAADRTRGADAVARPSKPYGAPDYGWGHNGFAAISIAWQAAEAYAAWLSAVTGDVWRLPTEAEWQLLADRAGFDASRVDALAWHAGNSAGRTHAAGSKAPDALGLVDLFGNAAEWVRTLEGGHVTRGGSFRDAASAVGPQARAVPSDLWNERDPQIPPSRWWLSDGPFVGFRLVREIPAGREEQP
jgi:formylglycine-generating enzyme required for sulfatase activity